MIDLHMHSVFSDGTDTPEEIIEKAHSLGLKAVALTDHDTVGGLPDFFAAAKRYPNLTAIGGCELAISHPTADIEILALNIQNLTPFLERQKMLIDIRDNANALRVQLLQKLGFDIAVEELALDDNGRQRQIIGRPHFAQLMLKKGYVKTFQEAFCKYMNPNCPAYVPKRNPSLRDTLEFIRKSGAFASLAHPVHTGFNEQQLVKFLQEAKSLGLQGVECYHSDHSLEQIDQYCKMATELGLEITGGSDYHGKNKPKIELGCGKGQLKIPDKLLEAILHHTADRGSGIMKCFQSL